MLLLPGLAAAATTVLAKIAPQLSAKLLVPCDLQQAEYVLVKVGTRTVPAKRCWFQMRTRV